MAIATIFLFTTPTFAQLPTLDITAITPNAAQTSSEFDFRITAGSNLDEITELRFSHAGITATVATDKPLPFDDQPQQKYGNFKVKIAADVPIGRYELRAIGRHGVSNPRYLFVHPLPQQTITPSHTRDQPTELKPNTLFRANATKGNADYFRIHQPPNQKLHIEFIATRLESRMIGQLSLLNAKGQVIQSARGTDEIDPRLEIKPSPESSDYTLVVHDIIYRGDNDEYAYHLAALDEEGLQKVGGPLATIKPIRRFQDVSALITNAKPIAESADPTSIEVPGQFAGHFDTRTDTDVYEFSAKANDQFIIDLVSQRRGEPTDAQLFVQQSTPQQSGDPVWQEIANADDSFTMGDGVFNPTTKDPLHTFKAPADGTFRILLRDLDKGESISKQQRYWLDIRRPKPHFDLVAYFDYPHKDNKNARPRGSQVFRGGTQSVRVFVIRHDGWTGAVDINVDDLPAGVANRPATIAADRDQISIVLKAAADASRSISNLRISGRGKVGDSDVTVNALPVTVQWPKGGGRDFVRLRQTDTLALAVSDLDTAPVAVDFGKDEIIEIKKGGELKLPIKLTRTEGSKETEFILRPKDFPPKVSVGEVKIPKDKSEAELVIKPAGDAPLGTYTCWLQSEAKVKHKRNPQALVRAQAYRDKLQTLHDDPANADKLEAIKAAITEADKRVEATKPAANPGDLTTYDPIQHITIRIIE